MANPKNPIYFMHIAKTAGSYVNKLFVNALGEDLCILHSEQTLRQRYATNMLVEEAITKGDIQFISGHVYYRDWQFDSSSMKHNFINVTTIRNPIEHLASHIQWLDHYNLPEKTKEFNWLSEPIKKVVKQIESIDFASSGDLDHFITNLEGSGIQLLDNCQSRYFVCGHGSSYERTTPLTLQCSTEVRSSLDSFDLVLTQDKLNSDLPNLSKITGVKLDALKSRVNPSKSLRSLDTENRIVRAILSKRCLLDQWLWRTVNTG